jgi:hypothetical protein
MSARILILVSLVGAVTGCEQQPVTADRPQYMTAAERVPYIKDFEPSCLVNLRTGALSRHLSEEQRAQYCSCAAVRSSETITLEEMGMWVRTGDRERVKPHLAAVDNYCSEKLISLWVLETMRPTAAASSSRMPRKTRIEKDPTEFPNAVQLRRRPQPPPIGRSQRAKSRGGRGLPEHASAVRPSGV